MRLPMSGLMQRYTMSVIVGAIALGSSGQGNEAGQNVCASCKRVLPPSPSAVVNTTRYKFAQSSVGFLP